MILLDIDHAIGGFFRFYIICLLVIKKPAIADTILKVHTAQKRKEIIRFV
jgi:hypothetical protein